VASLKDGLAHFLVESLLDDIFQDVSCMIILVSHNWGMWEASNNKYHLKIP